MRIKKKDLRKREAQLPINYPAPTIENPFDYEMEKHRVETLCKRLANNEVEIRDAVLAELPRYLKEATLPFVHKGITDEQRKQLELVMMKLCLGIFYCFWHSDKPLVQHECAFKISQLIFAPLTNEFRMMFARCLFRTLVGQWTKIDHYRLDKYMALVRKLVFQLICFLTQVEEGKAVGHVAMKAEGAFISAMVDKKKRMTKEGELNRSSFGSVLSEVVTLFQQDVLPNITSVGLTMHLCDLFFDELCRAKVSAGLFVSLAKGIPCFAMACGNYVEKRVLDNFFAPLTSGLLSQRWADDEREGDVQEIYKQMIEVCKEYSVSKKTVRTVRVMFSEAQLLLERLLQTTATPEAFTEVNKRDIRKRIEKDVDEANQTRINVVHEADVHKQIRKADRRSAVRKVANAEATGGEVDPRTAALAKKALLMKRKDSKTRSTKRKKNIKMTVKSFAKDSA